MRTYTMDYLAYSYETEEGGYRFRAAVNRRKVGGVLVADYDNYKPHSDRVRLEHLAQLYVEGELKKVSEIKKKNVQITAL